MTRLGKRYELLGSPAVTEKDMSLQGDVLECMLDSASLSGPKVPTVIREARQDTYMLIGKLYRLCWAHLPGNVTQLVDSGPLAVMFLTACGGREFLSTCGSKNVPQAERRVATNRQSSEKAAEDGSIQGSSCSDQG